MWQASWQQLMEGTAPGAAVEISGCASSERLEFLAAALAAAQAELGAASKSAVNPHLKNTYADLADVWNAWKLVGPARGLALIQLPSYDGQSVTVITRLTHGISGQWVQSSLRMPTQATAQGVGSAITYARRYALSAMVGIAPDDDDANATNGGNGKPAANGSAANGSTEKHPAAARKQAKLATAGQSQSQEPAKPTAEEFKQLKAQIWGLLCSLCGVKAADGSLDVENTKIAASVALVAANTEEHPNRVPTDAEGYADISSASYAQLQALKPWLETEILNAPKKDEDPF